jgi:putative membrane protein
MNNKFLFLVTAAIAIFVVTASASARDTSSKGFLKKAIEGNYAEISMGDLAQKSGQSDSVKSFGKMLSDDHSAANLKAIDAAQSMGMTPPSEPNAKQKAEYDKLSKMSGDRFDKSFADSMVMDHKRDLARYKKEARAKNAAGEYASGEIDTLQKHLDTATSLRSGKTSMQSGK